VGREDVSTEEIVEFLRKQGVIWTVIEAQAVIDFFSPVKTDLLTGPMLKEMLLPTDENCVVGESSVNRQFRIAQSRVSDQTSITAQVTCLLETMHLTLEQR
jgi:hypothetical protein